MLSSLAFLSVTTDTQLISCLNRSHDFNHIFIHLSSWCFLSRALIDASLDTHCYCRVPLCACTLSICKWFFSQALHRIHFVRMSELNVGSLQASISPVFVSSCDNSSIFEAIKSFESVSKLITVLSHAAT